MAEIQTNPPRFFTRLKQHHVYQMAVAYGTAIAVLIQVVARAFPYFGWSAAVPAVIIILIAGFPVALVLAWLLVKPADSASQTIWQRRHWKLSAAVTVVVIVLVVISGFFGIRFSERHAELLAATQSSVVPAAINTAAPSPAAVIPTESVAVLPFENESGDKDQQYFSDGLSDDLINALSQLPGLKVIGRNSSFRFRNSSDDSRTIGQKLGVAHLLERSVQRSQGMVRISATLVNTADGSTLWAQQYDRPYKGLFALQDKITAAVAAALKTKLLDNSNAAAQSDRPPGGDLGAYNAYLQGQFYRARANESELRKAIAHYNEAVRLDPQYAAAYAALGYTSALLGGNFLDGADAQQAFAQAQIAIDAALRLGSTLAAAHTAHGFLLATRDLDWNGANAEYRRALELSPADASSQISLAQIEATLGHVDSAIGHQRQALAADPLQAHSYVQLYRYLAASDRLDEAEAAPQKAAELQPDATIVQIFQVEFAIRRGDSTKALSIARRVQSGSWRDFDEAMALQIGADRAAADAALQVMLDKHAAGMAYQIAEIYALRRYPDDIFRWLDRAWSNRDPGLSFTLYAPYILRYRDDPRLAAFCKKVGLPTTTDAKALP